MLLILPSPLKIVINVEMLSFFSKTERTYCVGQVKHKALSKKIIIFTIGIAVKIDFSFLNQIF